MAYPADGQSFPKVRTSTRTWTEEVAIAEADDAMDTPSGGVQVLESRQPPVIYEFSSGRRYRARRNPYE